MMILRLRYASYPRPAKPDVEYSTRLHMCACRFQITGLCSLSVLGALYHTYIHMYVASASRLDAAGCVYNGSRYRDGTECTRHRQRFVLRHWPSWQQMPVVVVCNCCLPE